MSFKRFFHRADWDDERRRELESYLDIETDANLERGLTPDEARARALRKLGNPTLVREEIYQMNTMGWLESLWQDLRYGARVLRKNPGFAAVALLSLALGIGANAAIFQLLDVVRLRTLPVHAPEEIVEVRIAPNDTGRTGSFQGSRPALTNPLWERIRAQQTSLVDLFAYGTMQFDLAAGGESRPVEGILVSGEYFKALDARAERGRLLGPDDDVRGCASPAVVISYPFWQREYGGAADVVGRMIRLDGVTLPIVGITTPSFSSIEVGRRLDVFAPICARALLRKNNPGIEDRSMWWLAAFGRLKKGVTVERATAELETLSAPMMADTVDPTYAATDAKDYLKFKLMAGSASKGVSGLRTRYADSLTVLLSIASLVLLIACANLANLMLARATTRAREIAVRLAIGASRKRVFRQLIAESLLLAGAGAFAGTWLAMGLSRLLVSILTSDGSPWMLDLNLDWRLVGFTVALAIVTTVLFGVTPALRATRTPPGMVMRASGRGVTADRGKFFLRRLLVVGQIGISLVLVVGALLFVRTLRNLAMVESGFSDRGVLQVDLDLRPVGIAPEALLTFQADLLARLKAVPGVEHAASAVIVPVGGSGWNQTVIINGQPQQGHPDANRVSPEFFDTLKIPFVAGRNFDARDKIGGTTVVIVNQAFVQKYLPESTPIGRTFKLQVGPGQPDPAYEVIGIVGNTKYRDLREPLGPQMFFAATQEPDPSPFMTALLRTGGEANALRPAVTRAAAEAHPAITMAFTEMSTQVRNTLLRERLMAALSGGFAALAIVLAAVGLYGLMSYGVTRRRNEIGIRIALGATRAGIIGMIVRETAILVAVGVLIGLAGAIYAARAAESLLFGLSSTDAQTLILGVVALAVVAGLASIIPSMRAARLQPTSALREEA